MSKGDGKVFGRLMKFGRWSWKIGAAGKMTTRGPCGSKRAIQVAEGKVEDGRVTNGKGGEGRGGWRGLSWEGRGWRKLSWVVERRS